MQLILSEVKDNLSELTSLLQSSPIILKGLFLGGHFFFFLCFILDFKLNQREKEKVSKHQNKIIIIVKDFMVVPPNSTKSRRILLKHLLVLPASERMH